MQVVIVQVQKFAEVRCRDAEVKLRWCRARSEVHAEEVYRCRGRGAEGQRCRGRGAEGRVSCRGSAKVVQSRWCSG